jgi:tRNA (guanine37-N1)-methyltransferase
VNIHVLTVFPEMFAGPLSAGILGRARARGLVDVSLHQLRDYARGGHLAVDDTPYGGGPGMVMIPGPLVDGIAHVKSEAPTHTVLLSPRGAVATQAHVRAFAAMPRLLLVCGRYEGIDERVTRHVDEELSIGDYILSGGEPAAIVLIDAIVRLLPGAVGNATSPLDESFSGGLLEYPQYSRPAVFDGIEVPEILRSGDHQAIARWRRQESLRATFERRPELLANAPLDDDDRRFLRTLGWPHG